MDIFILQIGFGCFIVFFLLHVLLFRFLASEWILRSIQILFLLGLMINFWLSWGLEWEIVFLSCLIYGLSSFVYILCVFGPYETSVRLRVLSLLDSNQGKSLEEILDQYNSQSILEVRLSRLLGAQDIVYDGQFYYCSKKFNAFFLIDSIARWLNKFIQSRNL